MRADYVANHAGKVNSLSAAAVEFAVAGFAIFPLHTPIFNGDAVSCSCGKAKCIEKKNIGKHPRTPNGHLNATTDRTKIEQHWNRWPAANIGLPTGEANGLTVLDVDRRKGGDKSFEALEAQYGPLPETHRAITGNGWHIYFHYIYGVRGGANVLGPGIDIRGDGNYIVAPPSLHMSGKRYAWADTLPVVEAPEWLVAKLTAGPRRTAGPAPPEAWRELFAAGACEGERDTVLIRMVGYLLRRGLDPLMVLDIVRLWNAARFQPPLPDEQVVADVNSICRSELRRGRR